MANFWDIVNRVIHEADIILEVIDARFIDETRNREVENKIANAGKKIIYVINKCDLAPMEILKKKRIEMQLRPCIFVSSIQRLGTKMLRDNIYAYSKKDRVKVGVVGYPNTGKSSIINALRGRGGAPVSSQSGFTKGIQSLNISGKLKILDTPGVIPYKEKDYVKLCIISAIDSTKIKEPDYIVAEIMKRYPGIIEKHYSVEKKEDELATLEAIALKYNKLQKGGVPNIELMSRQIMRDWQEGRIRLYP